MSSVKPIREEDTEKFQQNRLGKLVNKRAPGVQITFSTRPGKLGGILFRIIGPNGGVLAEQVDEFSQNWRPARLAEKTEDELWREIYSLSDGNL